jgi:hypothetical protein
MVRRVRGVRTQVGEQVVADAGHVRPVVVRVEQGPGEAGQAVHECERQRPGQPGEVRDEQDEPEPGPVEPAGDGGEQYRPGDERGEQTQWGKLKPVPAEKRRTGRSQSRTVVHRPSGECEADRDEHKPTQ